MFGKKLIQLSIVLSLLGVPAYAVNTEKILPDIEALHPDSNDKIGNMLLQSVSLIGIPYKWGGNTPATGLDCSGFIRYIFKKSLGITLPRTANEIARLGKSVPLNQLEPGDLLFFNINGGRRISHIGMYLGQNKFIQSPSTGKKIQITELNDYFKGKFIVAKRMVQEESSSSDGPPVINDLRSKKDPVPTKHKKKRTKK